MRNQDAMSWLEVRRVVRRAVGSSLHCSVSSVNEDGSPHVTPIGSVMLTEPGRGLYFEIFASQLAHNLERDPRLCILAVDSSKRFWLASLLQGRFSRTPAVRLSGLAGARRRSTPEEHERFERAIRPLRRMRGYDLLWSNTSHVRDVVFDRVAPVRLGAMTASLPSATSDAFERVTT